MIHAFTNQFCNVAPRQILIPPTDHEHDWFVKSMDGSHGAFGRSCYRVVVPTHAIQLTDKFKPVPGQRGVYCLTNAPAGLLTAAKA